MYHKVPTWVDLIALEHRILEFWQESQAFERLRDLNRGGPKWSFLDGPITANNPMGVHHAWGRTLKDAFQRFQAMQGCELRYQNGFDCQGLWVEVEVEKELGFSTKKEIESYGIDRFVEQCKARVHKYSAIQRDQSIRLGYWMDWSNSYFTMSPENNYTIWAFLKKCHQRGKIYRGTDVMPWSGRSGTGYSQMEVIEGRKLVVHQALFLKFPLRDRPGENLLLWTTTPWTLTSNVAAMVNPELDYVKLRCRGDGQAYYFAAENLNYKRLERQYQEQREWVKGVPPLKTLAEIFNERGGYDIEATMKGAALLGWEYQGPFDELPAQQISGGYPSPAPGVTQSGVQAHRVIDGGRDTKGNPVVVAGEGTGIVHTAPGCGDIDHSIGMKLGLPQIAPLNEEAMFLEQFGEFSGKHALAEDTVKLVLKQLKEQELLLHVERYPHVYPHCWRSGDPLVFRLVDEWYINMDWRTEILEQVAKINWIPAWGAEREREWLTGMRDWMISKKRYWGLALPIWVCQSCDHFEVMGGYEELRERAIVGWQEFAGHSPHRPWIDQVLIRCEKCGGHSHRIPDVGNPWLDAGIVPYATVKYTSDREYWQQWVPADLVLECFPGQFRNWFYALLAMSTMMEGIAPFKNLVGHSSVVAEDGKEMHKSAGNAIWFDDAAEQMGADIMRWIYSSQDYESNLRFGLKRAQEVRGRFYNTLWNCYSFFVNYARLDDFRPAAEVPLLSERPPFDRWILSRLQLTIQAVTESFTKYQTKGASTAIERFVEDLSNWYIRKNRRRFWKGEDPQNQQMGYETLYESLTTLIRLLAPIMPFTCEEIYQNLVRSQDPAAPSSVHHTRFPQARPELVEQELIDDMAAVQRLTSLALSARESARIKVRQPLALLLVAPGSPAEERAAARYVDLLREELNVKEVQIAQTAAAQEGQLAVTDGPTTVVLDTVITEELRREGLLRELLRRLQVLRKDSGLEVDDRIKIYYATESRLWREIIASYDELLRAELLAREISPGEAQGGSTYKLGGEELRVALEKA